MWINPKFRTTEAPGEANVSNGNISSAPVDEGVRLATLQRPKGEELRISLATFNGFQFIRCQVWAQDQNSGAFWPCKGKGVSFKLRELPDIIAGLRDAERRLEEMQEDRSSSEVSVPRSTYQAPGDAPQYVEKRRNQRPHDMAPPRGVPASHQRDFDECA